MKKLLITLQSLAITLPSLGALVACASWEVSTRKYLISLADYDWANDTGNLAPYNLVDQETTFLNSDLKTNDIEQVIDGKSDYVFNYDDVQTGYKTINSIKKQGTTGAPIVKTYRPNGNVWSDFGITSKSRQYETFNSVLTWDQNDADLKYNVAQTDIRARNFVADKSLNNQVSNRYFRRYHDKSNTNSSIVGSNSPYNAMMTNYAYVNEFVGWAGFSNLGWLTPLSADVTEQLHKNGIPAIGLLYLSGWEDLSREKLRKLLEKDSAGNYKIVDILINQALVLNFDGWYVNDEANGSAPNGAVLDNNEIYEIIKQFNYKAEKVEAQTGKQLTFTYYRNSTAININNLGYQRLADAIYGTSTGFGANLKNRTKFQIDFNRQWPGDEDQFFENNKQFGDNFASHVASMYYEGNNTFGLGNVDIRKYFYPITNKLGDGQTALSYDYDKLTKLSFGTFGAGAQNQYAKDAFNTFKKYANTTTEIQWAWLKAQEVSNQMNVYLYSGFNGYLQEDAQGYENMFSDYTNYNQTEFDKMISRVKRDASYSGSATTDVLAADPRFVYANFDEVKTKKSDFPQLFLDEKTGLYPYSYGYGNIFAEQTVVTDSKFDQVTNTEMLVTKPDFATSFSTGSGMYFVDRDSSGQVYSITQNYPWSNNRIADVMPTYQWDFWKTTASQQEATVSENTVDGTKHRLKIGTAGQLNGYFDYNNPYKKGNSLALANAYNFDDPQGRLVPGQWETNASYNWNLMGANLQSNDYTVDFVVRASAEDAINSNTFDNVTKATKFLVKTQNSEPVVISPSTTPQELGDGWYKISLNLNQISASPTNRISKIGLQINTEDQNKFIFNVGEFRINDNNKPANLENKEQITKITNEYAVVRDQNTSIRFNWELSEAQNIDYYEIFYQYDNKWWRMGQTTQNCYYINNLITASQIKLGIRAKFLDGSSSQLQVVNFKI